MSEFKKNGELLRDSVNTAVDNFKVAYFSLENKNFLDLQYYLLCYYETYLIQNLIKKEQ